MKTKLKERPSGQDKVNIMVRQAMNLWEQNTPDSELHMGLWAPKAVYLTGRFRLSSVFLPFIRGKFLRILNIVRKTAAHKRSLTFHDGSNDRQSSLRYLQRSQDAPPIGAAPQCAVVILNAKPSRDKQSYSATEQNIFTSVYPFIFLPFFFRDWSSVTYIIMLPFTLPFLLRFSSGRASFKEL